MDAGRRKKGASSMKKPLVPLLVLAAVLALAPAAMASDCLRCKPIQQLCVPTDVGGFEICVPHTVGCSGDFYCYDQPAALASEFTVAAVERLDEPRTAAAETLVASAATPTPIPTPANR
jgi:hypothetical protein